MDLRKRWGPVSLLAVVAALGAERAQALGLGEPEVRSPVGRALDVRLPLVFDEREDLASVRSRLLPMSAYEAYGLQAPALHPDGIQITIEPRANDGAWLHLRSRNSVREPVLELLLEVSHGATRLTRSVTLLFDLPADRPSPMPAAALAQPAAKASADLPRIATSPSSPAQVAALVPEETTPKPDASATAAADGTSYGPVAKGETLRSIATRVRPEPRFGIRRVMAALLIANPQAFEGRAHTPVTGATLRVPDAETMLALDGDRITELVGAGNATATSSRSTAELPRAAAPKVEAAPVAVAPTSPPRRVELIEIDLEAAPAELTIGRSLTLASSLSAESLAVLSQAPAPVAVEAETASENEAVAEAPAAGKATPEAESGSSLWIWLLAALVGVAAFLGWRRRRNPAPDAVPPPVVSKAPEPVVAVRGEQGLRLVRNQLDDLPRLTSNPLRERIERLQRQVTEETQRRKLSLAAAYADVADEASAQQLLDEVEATLKAPTRRA